MGYIVVAIVAYLLGSIPSGFLVAQARGLDIRMVGSGNIGATNTLRTMGKTAAVVVLLADALKGWLAVALVARHVPAWLFPTSDPVAHIWLELIAGFAAVLGHNYTVWLWFKGGKGIATSAGVLLALVPGPLFVIFVVFVIVIVLTRFASLASIAASVTLPFAVWLMGYDLRFIIVTAVMTTLAVFRHRGNIQRLMNGTESRIGGRPQPST